MISKAKIKYINSLQVKKFRRIHKEFQVEGAKSVLELLNSDYKISGLYITDNFANENQAILKNVETEIEIVTEDELSKLGTFTSNNAALAVASIKDNLPIKVLKEEFILLLDDVKDPGNLGTIIRIADWYGITKIVCSEETADFYNSKVISATMGSFTRISVFYTDLETYLQGLDGKSVYGALLDGENVHSIKTIPQGGYLLMGNESNGISSQLLPYITNKVMIPRRGKAESLNVAIATAILCDNLLNKMQ